MRIGTKKYAEILDTSLSKVKSESEMKDVIKDFATLLASEGKLSKINDIIYYFNNLWNERHKTIDVMVLSVDEKTIKIPPHINGFKSNVIVKTNEKLIGGNIIKIGDYIIDTSIRSKINALR